MDLTQAWKNVKGKPPVVCLCGSTRFLEKFFEVGWVYTLRGWIVLSVGVVKSDQTSVSGGHTEIISQECADMLDELHRRKIDIADEVFFINVDGYIGNSTAGELEYSKRLGKTIKFLEPYDE